MAREDLSEPEYLRHIERLVRDLVNAADDEGWLVFGEQTEELTPLQRVVTELAHQIRHYHFDGDGCLESNRPERAQVVVTRQGWVNPMALSPFSARKLGVHAK